MKFPINVVIELLNEGKPCPVDDLLLCINDAGDLEIIGWTNFCYIENLTKVTSLAELESIKDLFSNMRKTFPELNRFLENVNTIYMLCIDIARASIEICHEKNGIVHWSIELK